VRWIGARIDAHEKDLEAAEIEARPVVDGDLIVWIIAA
jgi:hypothetical protein